MRNVLNMAARLSASRAARHGAQTQIQSRRGAPYGLIFDRTPGIFNSQFRGDGGSRRRLQN